MQITFLGHAGFVVETGSTLVVTDPWLTPKGAFDSAWMQLPQNHHLAALVREKLEDPRKERFLYLSHEHKDHFDREFLETVRRRDFTVLVPRFRRSEMEDVLARYGCKRLVVCEDGERVAIPGGRLTLYVEDVALNRDSALLVRADGLTFFDVNDCKLHDRIPRIAAEEGRMDVFTAQFSGAIWHPTSYEYDRGAYERISRRKMMSKFEAVARALVALQPRVFLASAGPVCFLDPRLIHLNFEPVNIFPRAPRFFAYLRRRLGDLALKQLEPMPGDVLDVASGEFVRRSGERVTDENFAEYVRAYAERCAGLFRDRERELAPAELDRVLARLRDGLQRKVDRLALRERVKVPLYVSLAELPGRWLRVDFPRGAVEPADALREERRYTFTVRAIDILPVLDGRSTWEDLMLTFRMRLSRNPDSYDPLLHGFFSIEAEDLGSFCDSVLAAEARQERITVRAGGRSFAVNRFCPHQGADLTQAWVERGRFLVCPRHRWEFDLAAGGRCTLNDSSLRAEEASARSRASVGELGRAEISNGP